jgi:hypothetical protein
VSALERDLRELGRALDLPAGVDVAPRVLARLEGGRPRRRPRALAVALAALALALAVALAVPPARSAILDWLGIGAVRVDLVETLPELDPAVGPDLGERVSLAEARRRAGWELVVPAAPGEPDAVYVRGEAVSFTYAAKGGGVALVLTQVPGRAVPWAGKSALAGQVTHLDVDGHDAAWIEGGHEFVYVDPDGEVRAQPRLARSVLLWDRDGLTLRLEGDVDLAVALRVARGT